MVFVRAFSTGSVVNKSDMENTSNVSRLNLFTYRTHHTLKNLLEQGYFKNFAGLERHDRIIGTASCESERPEHFELVVTLASRSGGVTVEVLRGAAEDKQ